MVDSFVILWKPIYKGALIFSKVVLITIFLKGFLGKNSGLKRLGKEINSFPKKQKVLELLWT